MSGYVLNFPSVMGVLWLAAGATFGALGGADAALARPSAGEAQPARPPSQAYGLMLRTTVGPAARQPIGEQVAAKCPVRGNKPPQCR